MLRNPEYTGAACHGKEAKGRFGRLINGQRVMDDDYEHAERTVNEKPFYWVPDQHEALIPQDMWERIQKRLDDNRHAGQSDTKDYLFSRLVRCGHCGKSLHGHTDKGQSPKYRCTNSACCSRSVSEPWLLQQVHDRINEGIFKPEEVGRYIAELTKARDEYQPKFDPKALEAIDKKIHTVNKRLADAEDGEQERAFRERLAELKAERKKLECAQQEDFDAAEAFRKTVTGIQEAVQAYRILANINPPSSNASAAALIAYTDLVNDHIFNQGQEQEVHGGLFQAAQALKQQPTIPIPVTVQQQRAALQAFIDCITIY